MERDKLVDLLYEGAADDAALQSGIQEILRLTRSRVAQFGVNRRSNGSMVNYVGIGIDPRDLRTYADHFADTDPRWLLSARSEGRIVTTPESLPDRKGFENSVMFNEFLDKISATYAMSASFPLDRNYSLYFNLLRGSDGADYQPGEVQDLARFLPALKRSLTLRIKFGALESSLTSLEALVNRLETPIFLVDRRGTLIRANWQGQQALAQGAFLALRNGRVEPRSPRFITALSALIVEMSRSRPDDALAETNSTLPLSASDGRKAIVSLMPLHSSLGVVPGAEVAIFLRELAPVRHNVGWLRFIFGWTDAETRLAEGLVLGQTLQEIASHWCVSRETLKTQLKVLYLKTGVHSQSGLILLLTGLLSTGWTGMPLCPP